MSDQKRYQELNLGNLQHGACYDDTTLLDAYFNPLQEGMRYTGTEIYTPKILLP